MSEAEVQRRRATLRSTRVAVPLMPIAKSTGMAAPKPKSLLGWIGERISGPLSTNTLSPLEDEHEALPHAFERITTEDKPPTMSNTIHDDAGSLLLTEVERKNQVLKQDVSRLRQERDGLRVQHERESQALRQTMSRLRQERDELQVQHDELQGLLEEGDEEQERLKEQVIQYKRMISMSTRVDDQTADDVIDRSASDIFCALQNFVVKRFRGVAFDFNGLPDATKAWARAHIPAAHDHSATNTIKVVMAILSKTLTYSLQAEHAFGVPRSGKLIDAATKLAALRPDTNLDTKQWIETTRKLISYKNSRILQQAESDMIRAMLGEVKNDLSAATPVQWTEDMTEALSKVFSSTLELSRVLHRQSAQFCVEMPYAVHNRATRSFNDTYMQDLTNDDEDAPRNRVVGLVVFPLIYKFGDEKGEKRDISTIVTKARVMTKEVPPPSQVQPAKREQTTFSNSSTTATHGGVSLYSHKY